MRSPPWNQPQEGTLRILYGVTGEGMGHAIRSRVVIAHLEAQGHRVLVAASGRAHGYLQTRCREALAIEGLALRYAHGRVAIGRSCTSLLGRSPGMVRRNLALYREQIASFDPEVCLTDFDSFAHVYGRLAGCPVISLDHQHVLDRFEHGALAVPDLALARGLVRAKLPGCLHYLVTSFYFPQPRPRCAANTTLVGPILRAEIQAAEPRTGEHVLVYQTSTSDQRLLPSLGALPEQRFLLYGWRGASAAPPNVTLRPFSEAQFVADLASARAVVCNGGYTTLSEALSLGKPVLSVPIPRQGEQQLNAAYLERLGLGQRAASLDAGVLERFLAHDWAPRPRLEAGNRAVFAKLDELLAAAA